MAIPQTEERPPDLARPQLDLPGLSELREAVVNHAELPSRLKSAPDDAIILP